MFAAWHAELHNSQKLYLHSTRKEAIREKFYSTKLTSIGTCAYVNVYTYTPCTCNNELKDVTVLSPRLELMC